MFKDLKQLVQKRYEQLAKDQQHIFYKDVDRDKVWDIYLSGFKDDAIRQSNNCNCCKSFLRQFSGICFIDSNFKVQSIWGFPIEQVDEEYNYSMNLVRDYIASLPITNVFLPESKIIGTLRNFDNEKKVFWEHFSLELGDVTLTRAADRDSKAGLLRIGKQTLKRALDELTIDSLETMLELTAQNSLYRGQEFKNLVHGFLLLKREYNQLTHGKDEFCWLQSLKTPHFNGIRGSAIGTFLEDLSVGIELDDAVKRYEVKVAPSNYKRPTALVTPRMVEEVKKKIEELGFMESLERRFAVSTDLNINNLLFTDRSSEMTDIFADMQKDTLVNPKTFSKTEEISIVDFIKNVLPSAKTVEVLTENKHLPNLVSLITAVNPDAPTMFKWNNPFSWSYTGGVADSIKERVKSAGGNVTGVLRFSIQWNDEDTLGIPDLDAHAYEPNGEHIYFANYRGSSSRTRMSGNLDVDMRGHAGEPKVRVENITWTDINKMKDGVYTFHTNNFNSVRNTGFKAQIEFNGEIHNFHYKKHFTGTINVATVTLKNGVFTIQPVLESNFNVTSTQKWGVKTNQFTKVKNILLSPNHWTDTNDHVIGNKHFIFLLENCINDEDARPFYNEHLNNALNENRKVLEVMGSKLKIKPSLQQLSGLGFSENQQNELIVRVTGSIKRNLKIKF